MAMDQPDLIFAVQEPQKPGGIPAHGCSFFSSLDPLKSDFHNS